MAELPPDLSKLNLDDPNALHHNLDVVNNPRKTTASELHKQAKQKALENPSLTTLADIADTNAPDRHITASGAEDLTLILQEDAAAERELDLLYKEHNTYNNKDVLLACIRVLESWIGLYKLQSMDELIEKIEGFANERYKIDPSENIFVKILQLKAFLRFKQHRFQDAYDLFDRFKGITGPSPELLENMGHTLNSLGRDKEAVDCFKEAIEIQNGKVETIRLAIIDKIALDRADQREAYKTAHDGEDKPELTSEEEEIRKKDEEAIIEYATESVTMEMGGLLLGLATSLKKQGEYTESYTYLNRALALYQKRFNGQDHSLIAKTLTSVSDLCTRLKDLPGALQASTEAVRIFKVTCGISPLTANALQGLGDVNTLLSSNVLGGLDEKIIATLTQSQRMELVAKNWFYSVQAVLAYDEAFELHCGFDTPDYNQIIRLTQSILDTKTKLLNRPFPSPKDQPLTLTDAMGPYIPSIKTLIETIKNRKESETDEAAVLNKSFGEVALLAGDYTYGIELLYSAKKYFKSVTHFDCAPLIETCNGLIQAGIGCAKREEIKLSLDEKTLLA